MEPVILVDTTLRDGGLVNNFGFSDDFVQALYRANAAAGIQWMEFGYRADRALFPPEQFGKWKYATDADIRAVVGERPQVQVCVMCEVGRCDYRRDLRPKAESPVDILRVATYLDTLPQALALLEYAQTLGYRTTCHLMAVSRYSPRELEQALEELKTAPAQGVYVVDSYGALYPRDIGELTARFRDKLEPQGIPVGIHAHNNQQCAFANTLAALEAGARLLDASALGMGRGAGNCGMEALVGYLGGPLEPLLELVEQQMLPIREATPWGYNTAYLLTGLTNRHPSSAIAATGQGRRDYAAQLAALREAQK